MITFCAFHYPKIIETSKKNHFHMGYVSSSNYQLNPALRTITLHYKDMKQTKIECFLQTLTPEGSKTLLT